MNHIRLCVLTWAVLAGYGATNAAAAPAPWYLWRGLSAGPDVCAQASPGAGWTRSGGPFLDAACQRRLRIVPL